MTLRPLLVVAFAPALVVALAVVACAGDSPQAPPQPRPVATVVASASTAAATASAVASPLPPTSASAALAVVDPFPPPAEPELEPDPWGRPLPDGFVSIPDPRFGDGSDRGPCGELTVRNVVEKQNFHVKVTDAKGTKYYLARGRKYSLDKASPCPRNELGL